MPGNEWLKVGVLLVSSEEINSVEISLLGVDVFHGEEARNRSAGLMNCQSKELDVQKDR